MKKLKKLFENISAFLQKPFFQKASNFGLLALGAFASMLPIGFAVFSITRDPMTPLFFVSIGFYLAAAVILSSFFIAKDWVGRKHTIFFGWQEYPPASMKALYVFFVIAFSVSATGIMIAALSG